MWPDDDAYPGRASKRKSLGTLSFLDRSRWREEWKSSGSQAQSAHKKAAGRAGGLGRAAENALSRSKPPIQTGLDGVKGGVLGNCQRQHAEGHPIKRGGLPEIDIEIFGLERHVG